MKKKDKEKSTKPLTQPDEALVHACVDGDLARVRAAVAAGAKIDRDGIQLPLVEAARRGHTGLVKWLLEHGANPMKGEPNGDTALFEAARNGHAAILDLCISAGDSIDRQDSSGHTPLMIAVVNGAASFVRSLLSRNANVNATPERGTTLKGTTALQLVATMTPVAFQNGDAADILTALRAAHADATIRNENRETVLHLAAKNPALPNAILATIFEMTSAAGLPVDDLDAWGCTPLWHASRANAGEHVVFLLGKGADPNARSTTGSAIAPVGTSVYAVGRERGDLKMLAALRDAGALTHHEKIAVAAPDPFSKGARVSHPKFGTGEVASSEELNAVERKVTVKFEIGTRVLQAKFLTAAE